MTILLKNVNSVTCVLFFCSVWLAAPVVGFECFSESNPLVYSNTKQPITHLPTIRLFQGQYGSQYAIEWAAYIFLTEKLGVNVTWYPSDDHDILLNPEDYGFDDSPGYPHYYFDWIAEDRADLLFEIWPVAMEEADSESYFDAGTVYDGGASGVFGEVGWWVPQYLVDTLPIAIVPEVLKSNASLRESMISAIRNDGDIDWIDKWFELRADDVANGTYEYDLANETASWPTVFGSLDSYSMSQYAHKQQQAALDGAGMDFNYATFGSEAVLTDFVLDMYSKRLPFVANLYSPTIDFATTLNSTSGELMEFQRVAFERNPSNTVEDVCYKGYYCRQPLVELNKIGNPQLATKFPEMIEFLDAMTLDSTDVLNIMLYHDTFLQAELEALNTSEYLDLTNTQINELWAEAACQWLQNNTGILSDWDVTIDLLDCVNDENQTGCGFDFYYNNSEKVWTNRDVAGVCDYGTGECICSHDNLIEDCTVSCPGLIGPTWNGTNFEFEFCSGHGECDIDTRICTCDEGYGSTQNGVVNNDCSLKYEKYSYDDTLTGIFVTLFVLIIFLMIASMAWLKANDQYTTVKAIAPRMTILFTLGLILIATGAMVYLFHPATSVTCNLNFYAYGLGAVMTVTAPLLKAYRIAKIYYNAQTPGIAPTVIKDVELLRMMGMSVAFELLVCMIYSILHETNGGAQCSDNEEFSYIECECNQSAQVSWIENLNYSYGVALLVALIYFAVRSRPAAKMFKESNCTYFGSFFTLFTFLVVVVFNLVSNDLEVIITIQSCGVLIVLIVVWVLFFGTRIYTFYMFPESRGTTRVIKQPNAKSTKSVPNDTEYQTSKASKGSTAIETRRTRSSSPTQD